MCHVAGGHRLPGQAKGTSLRVAWAPGGTLPRGRVACWFYGLSVRAGGRQKQPWIKTMFLQTWIMLTGAPLSRALAHPSVLS